VAPLIKTFRKAALISIIIFLFTMYILLVAVVIMLLMSALHIVNPEYFEFKKFDLVTAIIIIAVLFVSVRLFRKGYRKIFSIVQEAILNDVSGRR
jgi:uncharacterized membrane protein